MDVTRLVETNNDAGTVIAVSSTSPSLSSLNVSSGAGNSGTTTTAAVEHPLEGTTPTTSGSLSSPCDNPTNTNTDTNTNTIIPNTVNLNTSTLMASSPPTTHTREPRSAVSTPSNLSFREGYTNLNNNTNNTTNVTNVTIGHEANQQPPSPMARPRSVQSPVVSNSEHLPLHILAERRPRPTESIISSMSHSSSRVRIRPLSVTIDLSSVDPPAYEPSSLPSTQELQLDLRSQQHRISLVPSLAGSMVTSIQQEQNLRPLSNYSANTSIAVGSTRAGPVTTPLHSTAGTEGVSVVVSPSMSVPRRPFLEEDELPEYITLSENGPPFKISASESITYTVTPSQGPEEFQQQFQDEIVIHQPASRRRITGPDHSTSLSFSGTYDHGRGDTEPETTLHTRRGAWTLEYWVNDTIMYLCYLMDPKHSTTTALVPRRLVPDSPATTTDPRGESNGQTTTSPAPPAPVLVNDRASGDLFNAFMAPETNPEDETETSNEEQTTMERVPTGHLRGRPPPLTRPRMQQSYYRFVPNEVSRTVDATYRVGGSGALTTAVIARPRRVQNEETLDVSSSTPVSGSVTVPVEEEQNDPVVTEENQEESAIVAEEPSGDAPRETSVAVDPVETEQISEIDAPVDDTSPVQPPQSPRQQHTLPLPPIRPLPEDQPANDTLSTQPEHTFFNNALTAEFFKNPTYALVSAEDPQTWIWWSTHHEHNLQRSRQEGPHEEVLMWWRTRTDSNTKESKDKRKRLKQWQQWQAREVALAQQQRREMRRQARQEARLGSGGAEHSSSRVRSNRRNSQSQSQTGYQTHSTATQLSSSSSTQRKSDKNKNKNKKSQNNKPKGTLSERFFALLESKFPSTPHNETMEITMRVRGLYYAWREDDCGALPPLSSTTSRYGTQSDVREPRQRHRHRHHHHHHSRDNQYYQEDLQEDTGPSEGPPSSTPPPPMTPLSQSPIPPPAPQPQPRTHTSSSLPLLHHLKSRPRMFTLVRDDSLVMGQRVKGGPVAEIWIGDDSDPSVALYEYFATTTYPSMLSEEIAPSSSMHHGVDAGVMPSSTSMSTPGSTTTTPYYAYLSGGGGGGGATSDGASSITSNNGNTFMTEVSVATGGPMRSSTVASTFMAPVPSGRSFASSMAGRYNVSMGSPTPASMASLGISDDDDDDDDDEEEEEEDEDEDGEGGEEEEEDIEGYPQYHGPSGHNAQHLGGGGGGGSRRRRRRRAGSFSSSTSSLSHVTPPSSFPPSLLRRKCVIRVLRGLNPEVETFALSTGPRLPELFELYTDQSLPGPSRGTFICSIITFAVLFSAAFIGVAVSKTGGGS